MATRRGEWQESYDYRFSQSPPQYHNITGCVSESASRMVKVQRTQVTPSLRRSVGRARGACAAVFGPFLGGGGGGGGRRDGR